MSYDLDLFELPPNADPEEILAEITERADRRAMTSTHDESLRQRMLKLAEALQQANPEFEVSDVISGGGLELNGPEDSNGIQIMLFDESAGVSVPYWHKGEKAYEVFREIWTYLRIIEEKAGYVTYDSQVGHVLDLDNDFDDVVGTYAPISRDLSRMIAGTKVEKRRWWQFW